MPFVATVLLFDLCLQLKYRKDRWRRDPSPTAGGEASPVFVEDLVPSPSALRAGSLLYGNFRQQKFIVCCCQKLPLKFRGKVTFPRSNNRPE
ncbi:hypothetical protein E2C01_099416 [Portunus trituberculatus]|uniref:Uncharacterized protein n=1 Tax=Portunus trituberculatus TaxID=210409 RepID=A0A5B7K5F9_PORTR|nr:hypothetical protein [Portunus trituberculatus]